MELTPPSFLELSVSRTEYSSWGLKEAWHPWPTGDQESETRIESNPESNSRRATTTNAP